MSEGLLVLQSTTPNANWVCFFIGDKMPDINLQMRNLKLIIYNLQKAQEAYDRFIENGATKWDIDPDETFYYDKGGGSYSCGPDWEAVHFGKACKDYKEGAESCLKKMIAKQKISS